MSQTYPDYDKVIQDLVADEMRRLKAEEERLCQEAYRLHEGSLLLLHTVYYYDMGFPAVAVASALKEGA